MSCFQRWNRRYNQLLVKPGVQPIYFIVGSGFHDAMEQFYKTKGERVKVATLQYSEWDIPTLKDLELLKYWNLVLPAMVEAYMIYYKADPIKWTIQHLEREIDVQYRGFRLRGKVDLTAYKTPNQSWIWDHKTAGRFSIGQVAGYDFRFQFMFYLWLMSIAEPNFKLKGYIANAVKKPELRVKKTETIEGFADRVKQDMIEEPDKYFYRSEYPITKDAIEHFQTEVVDPKIDKLDFIIKNPGHPLAMALMKEKNTDECQKFTGVCPYVDICRHGDKMKHLYIPKQAKHEELNEEIEY
jgi:hypothetical protein